MMSMQEAATAFGVSYTTIRKWVAQGRLETQQVGRSVVVLSTTAPEPIAPGTLPSANRAAWNYGRRYRPAEKA